MKFFNREGGEQGSNSKEVLTQALESSRLSAELQRKRLVTKTTKIIDDTNITSAALSKLQPNDQIAEFMREMMHHQMEATELSFAKEPNGVEKSPPPFTTIDFDENEHELLTARSEVLDSKCKDGDKVVVVHSAIFDKNNDHKKSQKTGVIKIKEGQSILLDVNGIGIVKVDSNGELSKIESGATVSEYPTRISELRASTERPNQ